MLTWTLFVCGMIALARANNEIVSEDDLLDDIDEDGWNDFEGRNYFYVPTTLTWAEAEFNCQSMDAHLASVRNMNENDFIHDLIQLIAQGSPLTWIGGTDCQQNDVWHWTDSTTFNFSWWGTGQPDCQNGTHCCLQINYGVEQWDDASCCDQLPSVCVKDL